MTEFFFYSIFQENEEPYGVYIDLDTAGSSPIPISCEFDGHDIFYKDNPQALTTEETNYDLENLAYFSVSFLWWKS